MTNKKKERAIVKVGAHKYEIVHESDVRGEENQSLYGNIIWDKGVIRVEKEITPRRKSMVLLHEIIHAIEEERDLDLSEHMVNQIAAGLFAAIADNPEIFGPTLVDYWGVE